MKVSIITPTFNSSATISETIKSIAKQTYKNIEHIIIDGKSTDNTIEIINNVSKSLSTKIVSENDNGIYDAMNKGIKMCTGEIVGILNSDDVFFCENTLCEIVKAFKTNTTNIVYGNINYVDKYNLSKVIRNWKSSSYKLNSFKKGWHPPHPSFFVKRELYENHGGFDTDLKIAADFDIMYRFMEIKKEPSLYIDKYIVNMRTGGESNRSINNIINGNKDVLQSFKKYNSKRHPLYIFLRLLPKLKQYLK